MQPDTMDWDAISLQAAFKSAGFILSMEELRMKL